MKNYNLKSGKPIQNIKHYDWRSEIEIEEDSDIKELESLLDFDDDFSFQFGELPLIRIDRFNDKMIQIKNRMN